jgi:hypothetical protein
MSSMQEFVEQAFRHARELQKQEVRSVGMITTQPGHNVSITMEAAFSVEALEEALAKQR